MARGRSTTHDNFQRIDFIRARSYLDFESLSLWYFFTLWHSLYLINVCRIREGKSRLLWKQCGTALRRLNLYSAFFLPDLLFLGLVIAIFMRDPAWQALRNRNLWPWLLCGTHIEVGIKKNEIILDDFAKSEAEKRAGAKRSRQGILGSLDS